MMSPKFRENLLNRSLSLSNRVFMWLRFISSSKCLLSNNHAWVVVGLIFGNMRVNYLYGKLAKQKYSGKCNLKMLTNRLPCRVNCRVQCRYLCGYFTKKYPCLLYKQQLRRVYAANQAFFWRWRSLAPGYSKSY